MGYLDDYREKINLSTSSAPKNYILEQLKTQFKDYLKITPTVKTIKVNNAYDYVADIQDVSQINKNNNDEKYCITEYGLNIQVGNVIYINDFDIKTWLVTEKENMTMEISQRFKIRPCNNLLTFKDNLNEIRQIPVIVTNLTLYSDGLSVDKVATMLDGKRNIIAPYNEYTKDFYVGQRFVLNHNSIFSISLIDDFTVNGLIQLTMIQEQKQDGDNLVNNLAENQQQSGVTPIWHF